MGGIIVGGLDFFGGFGAWRMLSLWRGVGGNGIGFLRTPSRLFGWFAD
jgi:hypothetical protein